MAQPSTQSFLEIGQIKEGVLILKSNALRSILMVSSLNYALKSSEEQTAIIYQFQNFLNSLDFTCQIIVQSRRLNITGYLEKLRKAEEKQTNDLLKIQISGYIEFIESLVGTGSIMNKSFFVIVPFSLFDERKQQPKDGIKLQAPKFPILTEETFKRCKSQLMQRTNFIMMGLARCGLKATPLNTSEIIELFWSLHHPKRAEVGYYPEMPPELTL
jgi:KaiC/GvpD/RAD55 family RecA-like ATPase